MRQENKYLIPVLMLLVNSVLMNGQESRFRVLDSLTLKYYYDGEWAKLRTEGRKALADGFDYKFLRQRLGHAEFIREDYYAGLSHFGKAYGFDSYDQFTLGYLYYSYLNTGKELYTGPLVKKMSTELKKSLAIKPAKPVNAFEAEFSYKVSNSGFRTNPVYLRMAFTSSLGLRLNLYQSFSTYRQEIIGLLGIDTRIRVGETGSFTRVSYTLSRHMLFSAGYHYLGTSFGYERSRSNLITFSAEPDFNRLNLQASFSALGRYEETLLQTGLHARYVFPGRSCFYLKAGSSLIQGAGRQDFILSASTGLKIVRGLWLEGNLTRGIMDGYNDFNGLYVYNTFDPIVLRGGGTINFYTGKNLTLWFNFSLERKRYGDSNTSYYNQFSNLGGIKWKI